MQECVDRALHLWGARTFIAQATLVERGTRGDAYSDESSENWRGVGINLATKNASARSKDLQRKPTRTTRENEANEE